MEKEGKIQGKEQHKWHQVEHIGPLHPGVESDQLAHVEVENRAYQKDEGLFDLERVADKTFNVARNKEGVDNCERKDDQQNRKYPIGTPGRAFGMAQKERKKKALDYPRICDNIDDLFYHKTRIA